MDSGSTRHLYLALFAIRPDKQPVFLLAICSLCGFHTVAGWLDLDFFFPVGGLPRLLSPLNSNYKRTLRDGDMRVQEGISKVKLTKDKGLLIAEWMDRRTVLALNINGKVNSSRMTGQALLCKWSV